MRREGVITDEEVGVDPDVVKRRELSSHRLPAGAFVSSLCSFSPGPGGPPRSCSSGNRPPGRRHTFVAASIPSLLLKVTKAFAI